MVAVRGRLKIWCHIRVTRKSTKSTKSNLSTDRKCHFVSIFEEYVKNPVKQTGVLFPPSAPRILKFLSKNADFLSLGTTKVQTPVVPRRGLRIFAEGDVA